MGYRLKDIIDIDQFQSLQDRLNEIYLFPSAIIDNEGNILTATAWQDICTKFHRQHPECAKECVKSDQYILTRLHEANPAVSYRCPHGLIDNAAPIIINGEHLGNFFTGQFFFEAPDLDFFRGQARKFGFDEEAYLAAVKKVPVWTKPQLDHYLYFIKGLIEVIANIGLKNLREIEAKEESRKSEERFRTILQTTTNGFWLLNPECRILMANDAYCRMSGYSLHELQGMHVNDLEAGETTIETAAHMRRLLENGQDRFETRHRKKDGSVYDVEVSVQVQPGEESAIVAFLQDITERKRAEQKLRESENKYRVLFEAANDGIFLQGTQGFVDCNEKGASLYGLTRAEVIGRSPAELCPERQPDGRLSADVAAEKIERALQGKPQHFEWQARRADGAGLDVGITLNRVDLEGSAFLLAIVRDIAERKLAEKRLIHSRNLMSYIIEHNRSAIAVHDKDLKYVYVSQRYLDEYKVKNRDVIGKHHYDVFPDLPQKWRDVHQRALKGVVSSAEDDPYVREDGKIEWTRWECRPWYESDGSIGGIVVYTEVVTDQKEREERLRERELWYRTLFNKATDGIFILDDCGKIIDVNESFALMHGYTVEDLIMRDLKDLDTAQTAALAPERLKRILGGENLDFEVEHYHRDGHVITLAVSTSRIELGGKARVLCFHHDITERRRAERERQALQEQLHRSEKMEALGKLAGGVAHDLNNILGISMGYAELLRESVPEDSTLKAYADHILSSTQKGASIIEDMLTLARRGVAVSKIISLNGVIYGVLKSPEFEKLRNHHPSVRFTSDLNEDLLNIKGSPIHLGKTVFNLLSNAAEAISGRGEVIIRTENRYLDNPVKGYDAVKEGEYSVLTISDSGQGIALTDLGRIFEPFFTKKSMGRSGTGLGLSIVWGTVKDHEGYIDVQSNEGKGTDFTLYFPITREQAVAEDAAKMPIAEYLGHGESVLVVDDVKGQRDVAISLLRRLGYQVHAVASGEEAVVYLKSHAADILVLDMIMEPGIDGLETYRQIRKINPHQRTIIVSGFSETARVREARALGAGAYVKKPYIMEKIGLAIRQELSREQG